jgi:hypothetical protein
MIELEGNLDNRMRPAYSTAKTTIKAAACSNHPAIDGCEPLVSSATRSSFVPISHIMSSQPCGDIAQWMTRA